LAHRFDPPPLQSSSSEGAVKQYLTQKPVTELEHPHCSPDLAPNDLWMFPKIKSVLKGLRFWDIEDIQKKKWRHWKLFHSRDSKNVSTNDNIVGLSAYAEGEYFESDPCQQVRGN